MIPQNVLVKYQLDFATMLRGLLEKSFADLPAVTWDLQFVERGAFHEFHVNMTGVDVDVRVIVKAVERGAS